ncbi:hypothetical protein [Pseudomonas mandelii]|uniref:hypothetical protein n=1 Tax=Pseudomonas mandelii TaxID=75612 RepID=UPI00209CA02F|nr:hypothetical protein [Pseudomonas mandelii]MCO8314185.1 hypothetical protein [Pseudomonas mandelii]
MSVGTQPIEDKFSSTVDETLAAEITVDGVIDPDGLIPLPILISGTLARIQRWAETSFDDHLEVFWFQDGKEDLLFDEQYPTGIVPLEIEVPISASRMAIDGSALLYYIVTAFGMPDRSPRKPLIIDHTQGPGEELAKAIFINLTPYGYYNCATRPELTSGIVIEIPTQPLARPNDKFSLHLQGYRSLNGSPGQDGEDIVSEAVDTFVRNLDDQEIADGFSQHVPFKPCIEPLIDNDSIVAIYTITRGGRRIGTSYPALAKIDRVIPGGASCYV